MPATAVNPPWPKHCVAKIEKETCGPLIYDNLMGSPPLTYSNPDLAQTLQNRIIASLKAGSVDSAPLKQLQRPDAYRDVGDLEVYFATLEKALAETNVVGEQWRQAAQTAAERVESLEAEIATLKQALVDAEVLSKRWRQAAETAVERIGSLEANIASLEDAITESQTVAEQRGQDAKAAARRIDDLVADLFELTNEHVNAYADCRT